jgi:hypothetical protein
LEAFVRGFLARGWFARLVACVVVALAGVVWLGVLLLVLCVLVGVALLVAMLCCVWLVVGVWVRSPIDWEGARAVLLHPLWAKVRTVFGKGDAANRHERAVVEEFEHALGARQDAFERALAAIGSSVEALSVDLFDRQERLSVEAERLHHGFGCQIEAMRALVERLDGFEHEVPRFRASDERPMSEIVRGPAEAAEELDLARDRRRSSDLQPLTDKATADLDLDAAWQEFETDLRLEKIVERERMLGELEESLTRRERELAAFVAQTQAQLR